MRGGMQQRDDRQRSGGVHSSTDRCNRDELQLTEELCCKDGQLIERCTCVDKRSNRDTRPYSAQEPLLLLEIGQMLLLEERHSRQGKTSPRLLLAKRKPRRDGLNRLQGPLPFAREELSLQRRPLR